MKDILRKAKRQIKLCHDGMNFGFILSRFSQYLNNLRFRAFVTVAPAGHFEQHLIVVFCSADILLVDKEILIDLFKIRNNKSKTIGRHFEPAHKPGAVSFDDLFYFSLRLLTGSATDYRHAYRVSVKRSSQVTFADV